MSNYLKTESDLNETSRNLISGNSQDEKNFILLGTFISPEILHERNIKKRRFTLKSLFQTEPLKKMKTTVVISVSSLYQKLLLRESKIIKKIWDILMELVLAYNVITTLFFLAYRHPSGIILLIDYITWVLFVIDIAATFFTEKLSRTGFPIRNFSKLAWIYLKTWLVIDLISIIPMRKIGYESAEYYLRIPRLLKLPRVIDLSDGTGVSYLLTYFSFGKREKDGTVTHSFAGKTIAALTKLFISVIFIIYFLGCFFYWFQNFLSNCGYIENDESFSSRFLKDLEIYDIVLRSSYFMLTTISTIGFGDFVPVNFYEMCFIICVMLLGVMIYAYIMGSFNNAISFYNEATTGKDYLGDINMWLYSLSRFHGKIPNELRDKIISHFEFYYAHDRLKSLAKNYWELSTTEELVSINQDYANLLPEETYYKILDTLFEDFKNSFKHYFTNAKFYYALLPHMQPRCYSVGENILAHGKYVNEIVFVLSGTISIGYRFGGGHKTFLICRDGKTVIGDYAALTKLKNKFDYLTIMEAVAYSVNAEVFLKIIDSYFQIEKNKILAISAIRERNLRRIKNEYVENYLCTTVQSEISIKNTGKLNKINIKNTYSDEVIGESIASITAKTKYIDFKMQQVFDLANSISEIHEVSFSNIN